MEKSKRDHLLRLAKLKFLAPDIVSAIMNGSQPVQLTARSLLRAADLPLCWDARRGAIAPQHREVAPFLISIFGSCISRGAFWPAGHFSSRRYFAP
ncbi:MAG: hypothetical protein JOY99_16465 [Sphingomonadaceae bacterium]|nr:hypothetical protein [Sphingomonadaceae bacterium]